MPATRAGIPLRAASVCRGGVTLGVIAGQSTKRVFELASRQSIEKIFFWMDARVKPAHDAAEIEDIS
jgi:hypothetical protein